jgi:hypothetical protein
LIGVSSVRTASKVELDALASGGDGQRVAAILHLSPIKRDILRIADLRAQGRRPGKPVVISADDRQIALRLRQCAPMPLARLQSRTNARGYRVRLLGDAVLLDMLVTQPRLDQRRQRLCRHRSCGCRGDGQQRQIEDQAHCKFANPLGHAPRRAFRTLPSVTSPYPATES